MALGITDHALVRWLERSGAMDVAQIRTMLAASLDRAFRAAEQLGQSKYLVLADGLVFVIQDGALITVLNDDGRNARITPMRDRSGKPA